MHPHHSPCHALQAGARLEGTLISRLFHPAAAGSFCCSPYSSSSLRPSPQLEQHVMKRSALLLFAVVVVAGATGVLAE